MKKNFGENLPKLKEAAKKAAEPADGGSRAATETGNGHLERWQRRDCGDHELHEHVATRM